MKRLIVLSLFLFGILSLNLFASSWNEVNSTPYMNLNGILNPQNMRMNHTMSFMTGVSSGGAGFYRSVYTNHLFFDLHPKVNLNVDLNFVNYGTNQWNDSFSVKANDDNTSRFLPEFSLQYQPSSNTSIRIEFRSMDVQQSRNYRWW